MHESNTKAHALVNNVQRKGARLLLGICDIDQANTEPPPCAALIEANLKPAHVLRIMGLLRFWRIALSRDESSILRQVWEVVESHAPITDMHSLNGEIHRLQQKYNDQIGDTVPNPKCKKEWKKLVDDISKQELHAWYKEHIRAAGRASAYAAIRHELVGKTPEYLTHIALSKHERRNIAVMRTQCAAYVAAHAQHRETPLFGQHESHVQRYCQCKSCTPRTTDSTAHVMLHCSTHKADRQAMVSTVDRHLRAAARKPSHIQSLSELGSDTLKLQLLLGSTHLLYLRNGSAEYGKILAASAAFIQSIHKDRWTQRRHTYG